MKTHRPIRRLLALSAAIAACIISTSLFSDALAAQATLAWDANTEPDLAGYKIHYGTSSGSYSVHLDVHNTTSYTVTGLADGQTYYFAATAYNASGDESAYSNEVQYSSGATQGPVITGGPSASANQVTLPATATVSVTASDPNRDSLTYAWSKAAGPGTATFANPSAASTAVSFSAAGSYTLNVAVSDGRTAVNGSVNVNVLSAATTAAHQVTSFTLVDAATDRDIRTLADGDVINLAVTGRSLNIRANVSGSVRSVRFALDGNSNFSTENTAPYALAGDSSSNYAAWTPVLGSHSLKATPFSAAGGTGTAGTPLTIGFTVTSSTTAKTLATATGTPTDSGSAALATTTVSSTGQALSTDGDAGSSMGATSGSTNAAADAEPYYSMAVFRPGTGEWLLDLNGDGRWDGSGADGLYKFGQNGDRPVTGDWNDDGRTDIGVFRPSTGEWLLDLNGNGRWDGSGADGLYKFGQNGDRPVTGDWNNDGKTDIGVFRPATGRWLLDLNGNRAWDGKTVDGLCAFGQNGDLPVTGDWNDDGVSEIGVFRPATGEWFLDLNGNDGWDGSETDGLYKFGQNGDLPTTGQW